MESPATSSLENAAAPTGERGGTPPPANGKTAGQWAPAGPFLAPCTQKCLLTSAKQVPLMLAKMPRPESPPKSHS
jgi:hypothetical protein